MKHLIILLLSLFSFAGLCAQDFSGVWSGKIDVGVNKLMLFYKITKLQNGEYECALRVPQQGGAIIPVEVSMTDKEKITLSAKSINAVFEGCLVADTLKGRFNQMGYSFDLVMTKEAVVFKRTQELKEPFPYKTEEVSFTNIKDGIAFSGTISYPLSDTKLKKHSVAMVMVTGSGGQNRDEEVFSHKPFAVIADYMARKGIGTLRYDDRGVAKSGGDASSVTIASNMEDALFAVRYLRTKFDRVGVIGHSEGGIIAFMLASRGEVDFAISLAGTGLSGYDIILEQLLYSIDRLQLTNHSEYEDLLKEVFKYYKENKGTGKSCVEYANQLLKEQGKEQNYMLLPKLVNVLDTDNVWLKSFLNFSPQKDISTAKCPVFAINGELDTQVKASTNLEAIRKLLPKKKHNQVKLYPKMNHFFQVCETGDISEYITIEETISYTVLEDIAQWVNSLY